MTLILSNNDVQELLTIRDCIDVLEQVYLELAEGRGVSRTRSECLAPTSRPNCAYSITSTDSILPKLGVGASRITSDILTWPKEGATRRRVKIPAAPNHRFVGLVLLYSSETGEPLAIFPDGIVQRLRVGATSGLGIKYMARQDAKTVGLLGSGWQAGAQLMAVCAVRPIRSIRCFSPNRANREAFAKTMSAMLGVAVDPVGNPEEAFSGVDIMMCASNSLENIFFERWIRPGVHINSIKRQEVEVAAMKRADRIAIHTNDWNPLHYQTEDFVDPEQAAMQKAKGHGEIDFKSIPTLSTLIAGKVEGRTSDAQVTCFINNQGMGFQFAATGAVLYRKAKEAGVGRDLPTDWFTEVENN